MPCCENLGHLHKNAVKIFTPQAFDNYNKGAEVVQVAEEAYGSEWVVTRGGNRCFWRENNENRKIVVLKAKSPHGFMSHLLKCRFLFCTIVRLAKNALAVVKFPCKFGALF